MTTTNRTVRGLLVPADKSQPVTELRVPAQGALAVLQEAVGGLIQALNVPEFVRDADLATLYGNEEGKFACEPNMRATDFMVPGAGLVFGDYVAGDVVLVGFDGPRGVHLDVPAGVERRIRKIEREAGR